jgi:signal transduction histidine kinase
MKLLLTFSLLPACLNLLCQTQGPAKLDSMLKVLAGEKEDTNMVKTLSRISQYYYYAAPLNAFPYANKALALAEKLNWKRGISNIHNNLGLFIGDTGNNKLAIEHYLVSYKLNIELGAKSLQFNNLSNIGRSYLLEGDYTTAADYFFKALPIAEELKDNDLTSVMASNLAYCFSMQENFVKAKEYAAMTLKYAMLANKPSDLIIAYSHLGSISAATKDTAAAKMYFTKGLEKATETNDKISVAEITASLAELLEPNYQQEIDLLLRANKIIVELSPASDVALDNYIRLGKAYLQIANTGTDRPAAMQKAEAYLLEAQGLAIKNASKLKIGKVDLLLSQVLEEKGNHKEALDLFKKATAINDSLFSQEKKNTIAGLEGKHNIAIKDNEIAINKLMLANQRKTQWGLIAGLASLIVIGGLLYWQSRSRKKTNTTLMVLNSQLDEANKVKARFFSILSHDLRSPIVNLVHFLHLQKDEPDLLSEAQQAQHSQSISDSAENLLNTMEAMLLWSKEQMENFRPNIRQVPVNDLFEFIQKHFAHTDNISFAFENDASLQVATDENYLRTIMQNLTSNAIRALKSTPNASIAWKATKDADNIILTITDNGPGISAVQSKSLFDETVVSNEKHGLGLHLVRDLAKAIHFKIAVQSTPGMGTTFTLSASAAA